MVKLHSSKMFIKDPVDVWGQETTIGLAEQAVRVQAPPLTFDKRGTVIRWADFESGTPNYYADITGAPTHGRSNTVTCNGDFSYKIDGDDSNYVEVEMHTNDFHVGKVGSSVMFSSSGADYYVENSLYYYDGTNFIAAVLKYDRTAEKLYYLNSALAYIEIAELPCLNYDNCFSTLKVVADFDSGKYIRAICFGNEYDLSDCELYTAASAIAKHLKCSTKAQGITAGGMIVYLDNFILTENEPV